MLQVLSNQLITERIEVDGIQGQERSDQWLKRSPLWNTLPCRFKVHPPLVILWEKKERESVLELALWSNYFTICFK